LASCKQQQYIKTNLHITGNIRRLKGTLYIQRILDNKLVAIDTIKMDGNSSESNLDLKSPEMFLFI
jgi:hypothetical protein